MSDGKEERAIAHVKKVAGSFVLHGVGEHLTAVAKMAASFCLRREWSKWADLSGALHDVGKFSREFQRRIRIKTGIVAGHADSVDHSTAGAQFVFGVLERARGGRQIARCLAYTIAGHHAGLPDGLANDNACLEARLNTDVCDYTPFAEIGVPTELPDITDIAALQQNRDGHERTAFGIAFFIRYVYSCLVDADFLDTERFMEPQAFDMRGKYPTLAQMKARFETGMSAMQQKAVPSKINDVRQDVLQQCLKAALLEPGFFSLTVPTGGGKTLSSLAFALEHAERHCKKRIIYVIPYTSIIEQNARVFRDFLGDDCVVEHHSNFEPAVEDQEDCLNLLATENWDAPLVVTTSVQFFETLFSHKSSRCRKIHNMAEAVIILDEAQMIPPDHLRPCVEALRELAGYYGSTVVFCTATQPAIERNEQYKEGLEGVREIIPDRQGLYQKLRRVKCERLGTMKNEELAAELKPHGQFLCIVPTRADAQNLYDLLPDKTGTRHLSGFMCPAHRSVTIKEIKHDLEAGRSCRVVSTSLIEAGVDIDFPVVYRAMAGIDSIAQAAGRCNREGKLSHGQLYVFTPAKQPVYMQANAQAAESTTRKYPEDFLCLDAIRDYFLNFLWLRGDQRIDACEVMKRTSADWARGNFPFRQIGEEFRLIEDFQQPVIVPYGDAGRTIVQELRGAWVPNSALVRRLQQYTVQVTPRILSALSTGLFVENIHETYRILCRPGFYRDDIGLDIRALCGEIDPEKLII